jgi:ankyrin repeat protein
VYCQVDYICDLIPARIRHALAELPETLDATYRRTLGDINKAQWKIAHRLLQFVAVARRPLHVKELAELLAFDFEEGPIPKFREDWRLEDPVDAVLSTCSSLLAVVDGGRFVGDVIQFSHYSVKEFLTSNRLAESGDIILRQYHVSTTPAHTLAAQACLGILLHLDKDILTNDSLESFPLSNYAAEHWVDHARSEDLSQTVEDGTKQLFDPNKSHFAVCVWIHNPVISTWRQSERAPTPSPPPITPLHYASYWGLHSIVEFLVIEHAQDVHSRCPPDNATLLHLASGRGHVKVVRFLLERGADVKAQNKDGDTPLHLALEKGHVEIAGILIERGADVSAQNNYGDTPLHVASEKGHVEIAGILIERGADVAAQNIYGYTPLHLASENGQVEIADILIEHSADVTAENKGGSTALHLASQSPYIQTSPQRFAEVALILLEHGADATAQDNDGRTPFDLASSGGVVEVKDVLLQHEAKPGTT